MINPIVPQSRPILAYSRLTGDALELVPSASKPGKFHLVDPISRQCDCKGWQFRRTCRHLSPLAPARPLADGGQAHLSVLRASGDWPAVEPLPCVCGRYHRGDAERRAAHPDAGR